MVRILTIIGTRPQIIKASVITRLLNDKYNNKIEEIVVNTSQHYDKMMNDIFYKELDIAKPKYTFEIENGKYANPNSMIEFINNIYHNEKNIDAIMCYGDTTTTRVATIIARINKIKLIHIEAGLRSWDNSMPEEKNRIFCDENSNLLYCPTKKSFENLQYLKKKNNKTIIKNVGDVMYDNLSYINNINDSNILENLILDKNKYILFTLHRNNNTDNQSKFVEIIDLINNFSIKNKINIIFPIHHRAKLNLEKNQKLKLELNKNKYFKIIDPLSYKDIIKLIENSKIIFTDSGGLQRESFWLGKPSIIFRDNTEWTEIIDNNASILLKNDYNKLQDYYELMIRSKIKNYIFDLSAPKIIRSLKYNLKKSNYINQLQNNIEILKKGGVIIYKSDTLWALGCDATNNNAVQNLKKIKNRDTNKNGLICIVNNINKLEKYVGKINIKYEELINNLSEKTTIIYENPIDISNECTSENNQIAIRVVNNHNINDLLSKLDFPLVSTSANISNDPFPVIFEEINIDILSQINGIYRYENDNINNKIKASKIIKIEDEQIRVIRE